MHDSPSADQEAPAAPPQEILRRVIWREDPVSILRPLRSAIDETETRVFSNLSSSAVCLDTNLIFKALASSKREEIIDYFLARHSGPLIVSAQSMQEFWNNYHNVLETIGKKIDNKLSELEKSLAALDGNFSDYAGRIREVLNEFKHDNEHLFSKDLRRQVLDFVSVLKDKGLESEAPRNMFHDAALRRKAAKTPPGFKDGGDGDFYVWLDFLYGLIVAKSRGGTFGAFNRAILVTADRKIDWVKGSAAHPVLVAEVDACVQVPFEIWSLADLLRGIDESPPNPQEKHGSRP